MREDLPDSPIPESLVQSSKQDSASIKLHQQTVGLSHLNKVFWPKTNTTKRDLLRYYCAVAPALLPQIKNRPLVVQRYPEGVDGPTFFQHNAGDKLPDFIRTYAVEEHGHMVKYALGDNLAGLLHFINLGAIPLHTWNVTTDHLESPDRIIFDLDPGGDFSQVPPVATAIRTLLDKLGLFSYPKTSGAAGLHICIPISPIYSGEQTVGFARLVGDVIERSMPELVTTQRRIKNRNAAQIYLDCLQNGVGKTVVAAYSVRAQPTPTVSTPLAWSELTQDLKPELFTIESVPERLKSLGDLYRATIEHSQELGKAIELLTTMHDSKERIT